MRVDTLRRTIPYTDPLKSGRHPFQTYMLALCVLASLPLLFGEATNEAVQNNLPLWLAYGWGGMLLIGSFVALVGSFWPGEFDDALTMERIGLVFVGATALVYGLCVLAARSTLAPFYAILAGAGCLVMYLVYKKYEDSFRRNAVIVLAGSWFALWFLMILCTDARSITLNAAIILSFGASCLRRARDIALIFRRAMEIRSLPVETEPGT